MKTQMGVVAAALVLAACGGSSGNGNGGTGGGTNVVNFGGAVGLAFSPSALTVKVGDTVTWQGDFATHPLVSGPNCGQPDGKFSNTSGSTYSHTFMAAGTYPYSCNVHCGVGMKGVVTVQ